MTVNSKSSKRPPNGDRIGGASRKGAAPPTVDEWIRLAELTQNGYFNRRQLEWRFSFTVWLAIAAFTAAFFTEDFHINATFFAEQPKALVIMFAAFFLVVVLLHWSIQFAHKGDKRWFNYYMAQAQRDAIDDDEHEKPPADPAGGCCSILCRPVRTADNKRTRTWCDITVRWLFYHSGITAMLLICSYFAITEVAQSGENEKQESEAADVKHVDSPATTHSNT